MSLSGSVLSTVLHGMVQSCLRDQTSGTKLLQPSGLHRPHGPIGENKRGKEMGGRERRITGKISGEIPPDGMEFPGRQAGRPAAFSLLLIVPNSVCFRALLNDVCLHWVWVGYPNEEVA